MMVGPGETMKVVRFVAQLAFRQPPTLRGFSFGIPQKSWRPSPSLLPLRYFSLVFLGMALTTITTLLHTHTHTHTVVV